MHPKLKLKIHKAIENAINEFAENNLWIKSLDPKLAFQMTKATELVFDANVKGQEYARE